MLNRRLWYGIDWLMILGVLLASGIGVVVIFSATQGGPTPERLSRVSSIWIARRLGIDGDSGDGSWTTMPSWITRSCFMCSRWEHLSICSCSVPFEPARIVGWRSGNDPCSPAKWPSSFIVLMLAKYYSRGPAESSSALTRCSLPAPLPAFRSCS